MPLKLFFSHYQLLPGNRICSNQVNICIYILADRQPGENKHNTCGGCTSIWLRCGFSTETCIVHTELNQSSEPWEAIYPYIIVCKLMAALSSSLFMEIRGIFNVLIND